MSNVGNNRENWRNFEVVRRPSNGRNDYRDNYENSRQVNQWFENRNRFQKDNGQGWNELRMSNVGNNRENWRNFEVVRRPSNGRNDYRDNYENSRQVNQWFENRYRFQKDDRRCNDRGYQFRNGSQEDDFSRGDCRNRGSSENFSRGDRRQRG
ncbi:hypothetical protein TNCV_3260521 [Trichonephila clavipes]|nr:hypothetical protein TNCV_3260521 [Trichonephila clavipes]